jgi:homoserine kinase
MGRNDHQKIQKGIRITKIVGADLPLETERNVAGVAGLALLDAVETDLVLISKSIKHKSR